MTWQGWTDENFEEAKAHYIAGRPASWIAVKIGCETRNQVIGKMHRAGISKRLEPRAPKLIEPKRERAVQHGVRNIPVPVSREEAPELGLTILQLRPFHAEITSCRWPLGGMGHEIKFCGRNTKRAPYCKKCRALAYSPVPASRKAASMRGALWAAKQG